MFVDSSGNVLQETLGRNYIYDLVLGARDGELQVTITHFQASRIKGRQIVVKWIRPAARQLLSIENEGHPSNRRGVVTPRKKSEADLL